jgi:hypothetical protein
VYLAAPRRGRIRLLFGLEQIHPTDDGGLEVWIDALIENAADDPIEALLLVYPHRYWRVSGVPGVSPDASDETGTLNEDFRCPANAIYLRAGDIHWETQDPYPSVTVEIPDPDHPESPLPLTGGAALDGRLEAGWWPAEQLLTDRQVGVLNVLESSLWRSVFWPPIGKGERRWFRWRFRSPASPRNQRCTWQRASDLLLGRRVYRHTVKSPYDVRDDLYRELHATRVEHEKRRSEDWPGISAACSSLVERLDACHLRERDSLSLHDMRLHLFSGPGELEPVHYCGVSVAGNQPGLWVDRYAAGGRERTAWQEVYQYKTGRKYRADEDEDEAGFILQFRWTRRYIHPEYFVWLSLLLGLLGFLGTCLCLRR